jgi:hypothetical protein
VVFGPDVDVYVDNGGPDPIAVFLDGTEKIVVRPGKAASFSCRSGSHRILARRGDRVVFDETKTVESRGWAGRGKYLLNPEATNRYRTVEVQYGMSIPSIGTYRDDEDKCRLHVESLGLLPAGAWIDVHPDYVLEKPPEEVEGKLLTSRKVVVRVPRPDADFISATLEGWERSRASSAPAPRGDDSPTAGQKPEEDFEKRMLREDKARRRKEGEIAAVEATVERIKKATEY